MWENKRQAKLSFEELRQLQWLSALVLSLIALWTLGGLDFGGKILLLPAAAAMIAVLLYPHLPGRVPMLVWRVAPSAILVFIGIDFLTSFPTSVFIPPLIRMVMLLLTFRAVRYRRRREDLQLVLICLFCVILSGVLTMSLQFALAILVFTPIAMAQLFLIALLNDGRPAGGEAELWEGFRWRRLMRRLWLASDLRALSLGAAMFVLVVGVSAALFIVTPRYDIGRMLPFMELKARPVTGFSDRVKLGEVTEIREDDSVALRVDVPSKDSNSIASTPYWRMLVLDQYSDGTFAMSPGLKKREVHTLNGRNVRGWGPPAVRDDESEWDFYLEGGISEYLPLPEAFGSLTFAEEQDASINRGLNVVKLGYVRSKVTGYKLRGLGWPVRIEASQEEVRGLAAAGAAPAGEDDEGPVYPATLLELPLAASERDYLESVLGMLELPEGEVSAADFSQAVLEYLRPRYNYSLTPDLRLDGGDPVIAWLRDGSLGHCELFASAFTLLARSAGYPARMVVGFSGGSWNQVETYYLVRNSDAHAWVEIYDRERGDWLRVDPTQGRGLPTDPTARVAAAIQSELGWSAWIDSLRMQWYRRVVNFDAEDQQQLKEGLLATAEGWVESLKDGFAALSGRVKSWFDRPWAHLWSVEVLNFLFAVAVSLVVWAYRYTIARQLRRLFKRPEGFDPLRRKSGKLLADFDAFAARTGDRSALPEGWGDARSRLQAVRFGPLGDRAHSWRVIASGRRLFRKRRRST